jgi:hypothetical protein
MNTQCQCARHYYILLMQSILLLLVFLTVSCGSPEWETVSRVDLGHSCLTAMWEGTGAWNPDVLELWFHKNCSDANSREKLARIVGLARTSETIVLKRGVFDKWSGLLGQFGGLVKVDSV